MGDTADDAGTNRAKRVRDESSDESQEAKRVRTADLILLAILEEDVDSADRNLVPPAAGDLAVVLKSFEEEIAALSPRRPSQQQQQVEDAACRPPVSTSTSGSDDLRQSDLDYLLEASDDELGLPPAAPTSDEREATGGDDLGEEAAAAAATQGPAGLGQIWGFDDEIPPGYYEALGFGEFGQVDGRGAAGDGVVFDGGLFGYADAGFSDCPWRPESLPAV